MSEKELLEMCRSRGGTIGPSVAETMGVTVKDSLTVLPPDISEKDFQAAVVKYAKEHDWTCYHTFDSRKSQPGFIDLVFRRGPGYPVRIVVAELKVGSNKPTAEQYACLAAFEMMGVPSFAWWPDSWPEIVRILA